MHTLSQVLDKIATPAALQLSHISLNSLSAAPAHSVHYPSHSYMPHPLDCAILNDRKSPIIPWAYLLMRRGLFAVTLDHTREMGSMVFSSLVCLGQEGKSLVHGEFLGMSLLLEEVLQSSDLAVTVQHDMDIG